ncbi:MAG TPA: zf-HC2 domain-containing protein [Solirubrobacteraceae bacterium]
MTGSWLWYGTKRVLGSRYVNRVELPMVVARKRREPAQRPACQPRPGSRQRAQRGSSPLGCLGRDTKVNRCLAEGRKSFLARYAGIESGRECERLAPALSAFVDGEADAAQSIELRRHLRQCTACRAAVRGLHEASRPLSVVFPAAGLVVAGAGAEHTSSVFVRVYETLSMHVHERTANSFVRAQAIVDALTAGKMAAAAASAAALAGGGVAVEGVLGEAPATPQAIIRRADNGLSTAFVKQPPLKTATHAKQPSRSHAHTSKPRHHQKAPPAAAATVRASVVTATTGAASPAAVGASPPAATALRATAASSGGGHSASSEFGFEGP